MTPYRRVIQITSLLATVLAVFFACSNSAYSAISPLITTLPNFTNETRTPVRLAGDQYGYIYVTDPRSGGIQKYNASGNLINSFPASKTVSGIAVDSKGNLLVSQETSVAVFNSSSGTQVAQFGTFIKANGIAVDNLGNIYVTDSFDNCVQKFDSAYAPVSTGLAAVGKPSNSFGSVGRAAAGQFMQPTGIRYEKATNQLAIADTFNGRIQFYSTGGVYQKTIGSFGSGPLQFTSPQAVSFEYNSTDNSLTRMYVVDAYQSTIQVIDAATGSFLDYVGSYGFKNGQIVTPGDVLFDSFDPLNNRLIVSNGGGTLVLFGIDKVTGKCGSANSGNFTIAPTTNLCSNGSVLNFTGSGPWSWSCAGLNGGSTATCSASAPSNQIIVNIVASNGGSGSVTSSPGGINCLSGVCNSSFTTGSSVTLLPRANAGSTFAGWSGDCSSAGTGDCTVTMASARNATATFALIPNVRVSGTPYGTIASAYAAINLSGTIESQGITFIENLILNRGTSVTILGGFDSAYSSRNGLTLLNGTLTIESGSLVVDGLVIQ